MTTAPMHGIGVIGSGGIAQMHVHGYQAAGAAVVALCDVNDATLARRQTEWNVAAGYLNYEELIADPAVTAVSICTPNSSHHPITLAAAAAGKHVLCEKPVSLSLAQGEEMIAACAAAGVTFQVGHHMRSWASSARAKAIIDSGALGKLTTLRFRQTHDWTGLREVRGAFGSKELSGGGTLLDNGCHLFDLARYFGGNVGDIYARTATLKFNCEVEDTALATMQFVSGALGHVEVAWTATGFQEGFWINGTEGSLECDSRNGTTVLIHRFRGDRAPLGNSTDIARYELNSHAAHTNHVMNFLAAIEGRRDVVCTGQDGLAAVRLVLAAYESAERGAPVAL